MESELDAGMDSVEWGGAPVIVPDLLDTVTVARMPVGPRQEAPGHDMWADRGLPLVAPQAKRDRPIRIDDDGNPLVRIRSVIPSQAVTFHRKLQGSFSTLEPLGRRSLSGVGPNELAQVMRLTTSHTTIRFAMQSLVYELPDGTIYTADSHCLDSRVGVLVSELKTSASFFFTDPAYRATLAIIEDASAAANMTFLEETGKSVRGTPRRWKNVCFVYQHRFTGYSADREARVRAGLADGSLTTLGDLVPILGGKMQIALPRAAAMLCDRVIGFELDQRLTPDTPVFAVPIPHQDVDILKIDVTVPVNPALVARLGD
ncbi:MAG: hypothetical protein GW768_07590 [Sphingomonadales bacterium]|nr:hypothetical protein [Sphingomonadales bacterium]NCT03800.1 hypothetical protein [Sphingomonadales bacterium]